MWRLIIPRSRWSQGIIELRVDSVHCRSLDCGNTFQPWDYESLRHTSVTPPWKTFPGAFCQNWSFQSDWWRRQDLQDDFLKTVCKSWREGIWKHSTSLDRMRKTPWRKEITHLWIMYSCWVHRTQRKKESFHDFWCWLTFYKPPNLFFLLFCHHSERSANPLPQRKGFTTTIYFL